LVDHIKGNFTIIKYDQNPLKIRYEIEYSDPNKRWVIYLPFQEKSEEISYLKCYTLTGYQFKETLYKFLKRKGVHFPQGQKKIAEIKRTLPVSALDSIGKDKTFWDKSFEKGGPDIILPDFEDRLFNFIETPKDTYCNLKETNKLDAFVKKVEDDFGFNADISNQPLWQFNFVSHLCIVELFVKTGEPEEFPLRNLLPENDNFDKCLNLIEKIRDGRRYKERYKQIALEMQEKYKSSLREFAKVHAFETKVETIRLFDEVAIEKLIEGISQLQTKDDFIHEILSRKEFIAKKVENFWSRENGIIVWDQLQTICDLIESIDTFKLALSGIANKEDLILAYCDKYYKIDMLYRKYLEKLRSDSETLENFTVWVERIYIEFLDKINSKFSDYLSNEKTWSMGDILFQGDFLNKFEKRGNGKRAIFIIDALRFELGKELEERLSGEYGISLEPMYAQIPTKTQIGMAFLLSPRKTRITFNKTDISVQDENGLDLSVKRDREQYILSRLEDFDTINLNKLNQMKSSDLKNMKKSLVVFSTDIDKAGETGGIDWLIFFKTLLQDIATGIIKLLKNGFSDAHIVTDHGFLVFKDEEEKFRTHIDEYNKNNIIMKRSRFLVGENIANQGFIKFQAEGTNNTLLYFPRGISYFEYDTFHHGGISLHESIIPYIIVKPKAGEPSKVDVRLDIKEGIYNRIFKVTLKPIYKKIIEVKPRTVEVLCVRGEEYISNKSAVMIHQGTEEILTLMLTDTKYLSKGSKIKIIAQDQETQEILSEIDAEIKIDLSDEVL
jgi:hypothetical protein